MRYADTALHRVAGRQDLLWAVRGRDITREIIVQHGVSESASEADTDWDTLLFEKDLKLGHDLHQSFCDWIYAIESGVRPYHYNKQEMERDLK